MYDISPDGAYSSTKVDLSRRVISRAVTVLQFHFRFRFGFAQKTEVSVFRDFGFYVKYV